MKAFFPSLLLLTVLPEMVWGQIRAGVEFQINTYTTSAQRRPTVASDESGNFVVVWASYGQDGSTQGVFGQLFKASGAPQGSEFQVNSYTTDRQYGSTVASDAIGNFVVVWVSYGQGLGIFGQRFDASGARRGVEFQINTYTGPQGHPVVASDASGNFLVVWQSPHDGDASGIFGQRFDTAGVPQGGEFQVNSYTTGDQFLSAVTADGAGNFVVVWFGYDQGGVYFDVFARRLDASGAPLGSEFRVNSFTPGTQVATRLGVAANASGDFVIVWQSAGHAGDPDIIGAFGQRFDASGSPQGGEFLINSYTTRAQGYPLATMDKSGEFTVVWWSNGQGGGGRDVFGRHFNASGVPQGSEFQVNSFIPGNQVPYGMASNPDGDFVVVWSSGHDGSTDGIFGQRYGDLIFEDGFQSGDLTRWSSASTGGGGLSVSGAPGMAGTSAGLQVSVSDTSGLYVQDDTPDAENRYRARFYFDPNGFDPGESQSHFRTRILIAQGSGFRVITLVLKRQLGAYSVGARVRRNDGTRADTGFFPISDDAHFIELDWQRATGPGASDGSLQLWIDGGSVATLAGIDNDLVPVDLVRMGALAVKTGAAGTLYFDQFESRRQRLIGAE
jgi:hypothetical protein